MAPLQALAAEVHPWSSCSTQSQLSKVFRSADPRQGDQPEAEPACHIVALSFQLHGHHLKEADTCRPAAGHPSSTLQGVECPRQAAVNGRQCLSSRLASSLHLVQELVKTAVTVHVQAVAHICEASFRHVPANCCCSALHCPSPGRRSPHRRSWLCRTAIARSNAVLRPRAMTAPSRCGRQAHLGNAEPGPHSPRRVM